MRAVLLVLVLGVIATLVVVDRRRGDDLPEGIAAAATPTPSVTIETPLPSADGTAKPDRPGKPRAGATEEVPPSPAS